MKKFQIFFTLFTASSLLKTQPVDLSLDWITNSSIPFVSELENIIQEEVEVLPAVKGIVVIYKGQIVLENYYNGSSIDDIYNIWSVTKSFMSTLIGQAIDMGMMDNPGLSANHFFPDYHIDYLESITLHHFLSMSSGYAENWSFLNQSTEEVVAKTLQAIETGFDKITKMGIKRIYTPKDYDLNKIISEMSEFVEENAA